jgi:hypothetical protein
MTDWQKRISKIEVGSEVKYSREWLKSTGTYTGELPFAKGKVTAIKDLGGLQIATIDWNNEEIPARVNVKSLVLANQPEIER